MSYASSIHGTRSFCPRCVTQLTFEDSGYPDEVDVTTCSLDNPEQLPPHSHIYTGTQLEWVRLADGLPRYSDSRDDIEGIKSLVSKSPANAPAHRRLRITGAVSSVLFHVHLSLADGYG